MSISKASEGQKISTYQDILQGCGTEIETMNVEIEKVSKRTEKHSVPTTALLGRLIKSQSGFISERVIVGKTSIRIGPTMFISCFLDTLNLPKNSLWSQRLVQFDFFLLPVILTSPRWNLVIWLCSSKLIINTRYYTIYCHPP